MLVVHHLNDSRSQRILWLLEELDVPYAIKHYVRNAKTTLAPPELKAVHPLGKSPVITDNGRVIIESGAIVDYIIRHYGSGRMQPEVTSADYDDYIVWLHFAEGSAILPFVLKIYTRGLGNGAAPIQPRIESEIVNYMSYLDRALEGRQFLLGEMLTGADIMMSFISEFGSAFGQRGRYPNIDAWTERLQRRSAYRRALEKGGAYSYAK